jgi:hypothetical protein
MPELVDNSRSAKIMRTKKRKKLLATLDAMLKKADKWNFEFYNEPTISKRMNSLGLFPINPSGRVTVTIKINH